MVSLFWSDFTQYFGIFIVDFACWVRALYKTLDVLQFDIRILVLNIFGAKCLDQAW